MENVLNRVVISGLGVVSSLGIGKEFFGQNIFQGQSGISKISTFDVSKYRCQYAGEIKIFTPEHFINKRRSRRMGRASQMAVAASKLAVKDAQLSPSELSQVRTGICMGTTMGEPQVMERLDEQYFPDTSLDIDAAAAFSYPASSIPTHVASELKLNATNILFSNACAAGNYALGYAFDLIRRGEADRMLVGGADALSRVAFTGFSRLFAVAPEKCRPFDKNREGMIPGEGAGMLLLETLESAQKRGAQVYAEVLGYGMSCDARHMTIPSRTGVVKALKKSLHNAGVRPEEIDYISAHGTGTKENDEIECRALQEVFGERSRTIPASSIKSMLGHTMGAASALESIACCLAIQEQKIPPTINYEKPDSKCKIDCVPNVGRECKMQVVLNNSQAFGGNNACVVFCRRWGD